MNPPSTRKVIPQYVGAGFAPAFRGSQFRKSLRIGLKPFSPTDLLETVAKALEKDLQAKQRERELKQLQERLRTLTPREYQVFRLVVTGMLNKQIAFDLGTTEKTIKVHRARIIEKMGAKSLADLVRFAEKLGIRPITL